MVIKVHAKDALQAKRNWPDATLEIIENPPPIPQTNRISKAIVRPINPREWPLWAKALRLLATPEDKGMGDVVARVIGIEKSDAFKVWYKQIFGKDCNCAGREARWNRQYPLKT